MGLDTQMDLELLSLGKRQLFCLARAMLKKRADSSGGGLLFVDEATSNVDGDKDMRMQHILREEFDGPGWTWLVVAHSVATVLDFDKAAVFERGKLFEFDKSTTLLDRPGGFEFRQLFLGFGSG
jgi:ATP-binding cassette subfamily C (CFTR/MRP) protein 1